MERSSGILLHITSLPSKYGIGNLGKEAYAFVDFLKQAGRNTGRFCRFARRGTEIRRIRASRRLRAIRI